MPSLQTITSQCCTAAQFEENLYKRWAKEIGQEIKYHRKQWEYVYILEALNFFGYLKEGITGVGFGCGKEPLAAVMAKYGCNVLATDIVPQDGADIHWGARSALDMFYPGIVAQDTFLNHVSFMPVDMTNIPDKLHGRFDFVWSCCALEHLGSLRSGIDFISSSGKCLKSGGIAVHTTEFNVGDPEDTMETSGLSLYRKRDLENMVEGLKAEGLSVLPFNWDTGNLRQDHYIDLPPYQQETHLKLQVEAYIVTSIGMIIRKNSS
jgi:2-polyprenyl-3-methyl-5-hydroxy-6-metoxy-1,4-benzoquinol methylase